MADVGMMNLSLAWGHFQLRGGWRILWSTCAAYGVVILGLIILTIRVDPSAITQAMASWTVGLFGLQMGALVLLGCSAVRNAVRKDVDSKMLESHRLMPVSGTWAVISYLIGPGSQAMGLALMNLVIGTGTALIGGFSVIDWVMANGILLAFAGCLWVASAYAGFTTRLGLGLLFSLGLVLWAGGGIALHYLPGAVLLISPIIDTTLFGYVMGRGAAVTQYAPSVAAQLAITLILFVAAQRKYCREDVLSIGPVLGVLLVAWWVASSIMAVECWDLIQPRWYSRMIATPAGQAITTACIAMLLAIVPLAGADRIQRAFRLGNEPQLFRAASRPASRAVLPALVCLLMLIPIGMLPRSWFNGMRVGVIGDSLSFLRTAAVFLVYLISIAAILRVLHPFGQVRQFLIAFWLAAMWFGPLGLDFAIRESGSSDQWTPIAAASPIGALILLWTNDPVPVDFGLAFQLVVMLVLVWLARNKRRPATNVPTTQQP